MDWAAANRERKSALDGRERFRIGSVYEACFIAKLLIRSLG